MITGAAQADAAVLIVDATEGVRDQTRRHGYLLHLLGVRQLMVVINKMDRVGFDAGKFTELDTEIAAHLAGLGLTPSAIIPVSARDGDGVARHTYLDRMVSRADGSGRARRVLAGARAPDLPLRLPVQAVYKFDDRRIIAGRVESGRSAWVTMFSSCRPASPPASNRSRHGRCLKARRRRAWRSPDNPSASPSIATFSSSAETSSARRRAGRVRNAAAGAGVLAPPAAARRRRPYHRPHRDRRSTAVVAAIEDAVDPGLLASDGAEVIGQNHVGEIELDLSRPIAIDPYTADPNTGRSCWSSRDASRAAASFSRPRPPQPVPQQVRSPTTSPTARSARTGANSDELRAKASALAQVFAALSRRPHCHLRREVTGKIVSTTSFGLEDQAILHLLSERGIDIDVVTLDTEPPGLFSGLLRYGHRTDAVMAVRHTALFLHLPFGMVFQAEAGGEDDLAHTTSRRR